MAIDNIVDDFEFLDDWEDRYRYIIELGRSLEPYPEEDRDDLHKVRGCVSQVWLSTRVETDDSGTQILHFKGDSDAHIVRGLVAIMIAFYTGRTASEIANQEATDLLLRLGLNEHLTPQRSNGLNSLVVRMRKEAENALLAA